ncbi:hypothetical protein [Bradyrhizobium iriomotense]|uniref:hypothetical protein n=1 Tax=Bradyrhizobium iriomotense TaxID=441950 RepID=UPI001FEE5F01|nr:hypothetical protein [Bradyrhizobium iriomotense]
MAIASAVAVLAISFLAIDATVDVNSGGIAKRIETARASIADAAISQHQLAFAVQAWSRGNHQKPLSEKQPLEQCLAID